MKTNPSIEKIKSFWEGNPLFDGESIHPFGSKEFFEEHRKVYLDDVFNKNIDRYNIFPSKNEINNCLDLGCGVGFWSIEIPKRFSIKNMYSSDLTSTAIKTTQKRLMHYNIQSNCSIQNGEHTNFQNDFFDFINCQGVIHHTENPNKMLKEIYRILSVDGEASISVYYKNFFIRNWNLLRIVGLLFYRLGIKFKGRGRESILAKNQTDEIIRLYDGEDNPKGLAYGKEEFENLLKEYFIIQDNFLYYFPARIFPFKINNNIHHFLSKYFGFMICYKLTKR